MGWPLRGEFTGGEPCYGRGRRDRSGARLPKDSADAPSGQCHPYSEEESPSDLGDGKKCWLSFLDRADERIDAREEKCRQEQHLHPDGEGEDAKDPRVVIEHRPTHTVPRLISAPTAAPVSSPRRTEANTRDLSGGRT